MPAEFNRAGGERLSERKSHIESESVKKEAHKSCRRKRGWRSKWVFGNRKKPSDWVLLARMHYANKSPCNLDIYPISSPQRPLLDFLRETVITHHAKREYENILASWKMDLLTLLSFQSIQSGQAQNTTEQLHRICHWNCEYNTGYRSCAAVSDTLMPGL